MKMRKQMPILDTPLNADERALYNVAVRLDRIIELLEVAIQEKSEVLNVTEVISTSDEVVETVKKKTTKKK